MELNNMNYDEKIIYEQNKYKSESVGDVYNGYLIKEVEYKFNKNMFFDNKLSIYLPEDFSDLPEALAKISPCCQCRLHSCPVQMASNQ